MAKAQTGQRVWVIAQDPGGYNTMHLVYKNLIGAHEVLFIVNGKAVEIAAARGVDHVALEAGSDLKAFISQHGAPKVLLTSMCSGGGVGRDLIPLLRPLGTTIIAVQDYWGQRLELEWKELRYRPDRITTHDEVGKQLILQMWPEFDRAHIAVTGFPALDSLQGFDVVREGARVRELLGLRNDLPLVLFAGQGDRTAAIFGELTAALERLKVDCYLMPRPHPRTVQNFAAEAAPWQRYCAEYKGRMVFDFFGQCTSQQLIAATVGNGCVVSAFSTSLIEAAIMRANGISVLYPEMGLKSMQEEMPGLTENPLVTGGSVALAQNRRDLTRLLARAIGANGFVDKLFHPHGLNLRAAQQHQVPGVGGAAKAVADLAIASL